MAAINRDEPNEDDRRVVAGIGRRLLEGRWLIAALAILLAALYLAGSLTATAGAVILLVLIGLMAVIPRFHATERPSARAAPRALTWPETETKLFADALPDPCFVLDRRGIVRYANERAVAGFSLRPSEPLAFKLRVPDLISAFERVARGGPPERVEFAERVPTERWYAAWFAGLGGTAERPAEFVVLIIDDLTERRRSERIRVDFVANASHELRTPLASLAGFIETLQGPAREDATARERFLKIMQEQATRMSRLVDDLLSLSRIEMKAHMRPSDAVDLVGVVRHVVDALEPLGRDLGVTIETDMPEAPLEVVGDRDELTQVFENLVENACKYGQTGGRVTVSVGRNPADAPVVTVRDYGPGIPEEHLPRLTERFYRVDVEESRKHRGTGLGLAIVKHILARHRAALTVDSRLGEGAAFRVAFPQAPVLAVQR